MNDVSSYNDCIRLLVLKFGLMAYLEKVPADVWITPYNSLDVIESVFQSG
jgi:hypothetical protein